MTWGPPSIPPTVRPFIVAHLRIGWWMLLVFLSWGVALEAMHGFKVDLYLNVEQATTRLLWTVAHASGTILGLLHIAWAFSLFLTADGPATSLAVTSACLKSASVVLPAGCLLSGLLASPASLALGIVLLPPGLLLLLTAILLTARRV